MKKSEMKAIKSLLNRSGWEKHGGHPDKTLNLLEDLLRTAGFKYVKERNFSMSPDGYKCSDSTKWKHPLGLIAHVYRHYGSVSSDNSFSFRVKPIGDGKRD